MTSQKPTPDLMKEVKLFSHLSPSELEQLIALGQPQSYEAHANVVIEGELSWGLYIILEGTLGVFKANKITGDIHDVAELNQGNFFGEMSLVDENPRSASVRALTPCQVFYIAKQDFQTWLKQSAERNLRFYEECIRHLVNRLRETDENYAISKYQLWRTALQSKKSHSETDQGAAA